MTKTFGGNVNMTRMAFLAGAAAFAVTPALASEPDEIRSVLLHWGLNMWSDYGWNHADFVEKCRENISAEHLKGFMMAPWADCTDASNKTNLEGIDLFAKALA